MTLQRSRPELRRHTFAIRLSTTTILSLFWNYGGPDTAISLGQSETVGDPYKFRYLYSKGQRKYADTAVNRRFAKKTFERSTIHTHGPDDRPCMTPQTLATEGGEGEHADDHSTRSTHPATRDHTHIPCTLQADSRKETITTEGYMYTKIQSIRSRSFVGDGK